MFLVVLKPCTPFVAMGLCCTIEEIAFTKKLFLKFFPCFFVQAREYLQLERQFMDMGFSSEKIKEALLLTNRNQSKALEVLMANS